MFFSIQDFDKKVEEGCGGFGERKVTSSYMQSIKKADQTSRCDLVDFGRQRNQT